MLDVFCQEMPLLNLEISFCTRRDQYSKGKSSQANAQPKIPSEQLSRMNKIRTTYQGKVPKSLHVYAIGGSSGGVFASHISLEYPDFAGISVIVSPGSFGVRCSPVECRLNRYPKSEGFCGTVGQGRPYIMLLVAFVPLASRLRSFAEMFRISMLDTLAV